MDTDLKERPLVATPLSATLKNIDVDVIASSLNADGTIKWDLDIRTNGHAKGKAIDAKPNFGYRIKFDLVNPLGLDVRFNAAQPLFVREGAGTFCPTGLDSKQIMIDSCQADDLVVVDWNYEQVQLCYQLNFVTGTGQAVNPYDPIIDNGGGAQKP